VDMPIKAVRRNVIIIIATGQWNQYKMRRCEDTEAHKECRAALEEMTDMVNSMGKLADLYLTCANTEGTLNAAQIAFLRTKLSEAFEMVDKKPVPDCEVGLNTRTLVENQEYSDLCFSQELYDQCKYVQDNIDKYATGIYSDLEDLIMDDPKAVTTKIVKKSENKIEITGGAISFIEIIKERGALKTANIRCAAYSATVDEITTTKSSALKSEGTKVKYTWGLIGAIVGLLFLLK